MSFPPSNLKARLILNGLAHAGAAAYPRGAEIGVRRGDTSAALLRGHDNLTLLMVDPWVRQESGYTLATDPRFYGRPQANFDREYEQALENTAFASDRRIVLRDYSTTAASTVPNRSLDFVFIDACHSYEGCKGDLEAWYPKLKPPGFMCGHDYLRPNYPREGVKRAVDEFATRLGCPITIAPGNMWLIHPNAGRPVFVNPPVAFHPSAVKVPDTKLKCPCKRRSLPNDSSKNGCTK
ncbi:MAG TPA: class I SAM-dependent methyltransferase, partial [Terriglobales bacterium]|nr:class I SAM-dependent methyltransferase [Terriglobales bacterium]